jgi:hypothetical protein
MKCGALTARDAKTPESCGKREEDGWVGLACEKNVTVNRLTPLQV